MKKDYDMLFKQAEALCFADEYSRANEIVDIIIHDRPYYHNPEVYYIKLQCLDDLRNRKVISKKKHDTEFHKYINESLFSYYNNRDKIDKEKFYYDLMIHEYRWELDDKLMWIGIGFIKDAIARDLRAKTYRDGSEFLHTAWHWLHSIYAENNCDKLLLNKLKENGDVYQGFYYLYTEENYKRALKFFKSALKNNGDNALALYGLGEIYYQSDKYKSISKAMQCLKQATENKIDEWRCYYLLSKIYIKNKDIKNALGSYKVASRLYDEDNINAFLSDARADLGEYFKESDFKNELPVISKEVREKGKIMPDFVLQTTNKNLPYAIARFSQEKADQGIDVLLGKYKKNLDPNCLDTLRRVEQTNVAAANDLSLKDSLSANCRDYYAVAENEIHKKIFEPFKKMYNSKYPISDLDSIKENWPLLKYLKSSEMDFKKISKLTLGQVLGSLKRFGFSGVERPFQELKMYVSYHCPVLYDKSFTSKLAHLNEANNRIKHQDNLRPLSYEDDFRHFRELVMGDFENKGILYEFLESYTQHQK